MPNRTSACVLPCRIWLMNVSKTDSPGCTWRSIPARSRASRLAACTWQATGRVLEHEADAELFMDVGVLARKKYGWGDGLPVEFRLDRQVRDCAQARQIFGKHQSL